MEWIGAIIIGFLAGLIAKFLMPGRDPGGLIVTTLLGMAGAFVATWLGQVLGWYGPGDAAGFIGAVIGAIVLLVLYRLLFRRSTAHSGI
ncbi:MAG TPA: GlsB/YeaQ/YmgE family stress response membrane protein [Alphaproteobacteria bacterium]|nr:GlsB/YeaQ/YmgE family stress response membrane protein [Alphaproteobacteria bacterium]